MRNRFAVIVVIAALASATTISVTGQEDPLPRVTARGAASPVLQQETATTASQSSAWQSAMFVVLPVDPIRAEPTVTLAEAARDNDYATFHALYTRAREQGRDVSAYSSLDDLWTYAVTDPIGGFFSGQRFERLARAYPGFRAYMETYRIVDSRGQVFYPSAEARSFLLAEALRGNEPTVPVVSSPRADSERPARAAARTTTARTTPRRAATPRRSPAPLQDWSAAAKGATTVAPATKPAGDKVAAPATAAVSAAPPAVEPGIQATERVETPAPATSSAVGAPTALDPAAPAEAAPVTAAPVADSPVTEPSARPAPQSSATGRGLLLLVIGLIGVGILALMLRTPREEMPRSIIDHSAPVPPKDGEKPHATVEPIRKRSPKPTPPTPPRQTGTHS